MARITILILTLFLISSTAAADGGFFIGVSAGKADLDETFGTIELPSDDVEITLDDEEPAWGVFAGYQFSRYVGLRIGYVDFATFDDVLDLAGVGDIPGVDFDLDGWTAGVDGYLPVTDWLSLVGHLGAITWDAEVQIALLSIGVVDEGTDVYYGAGLEFTPVDFLGIEGSYTRYEINDSDIDYLSLGVRFKF